MRARSCAEFVPRFSDFGEEDGLIGVEGFFALDCSFGVLAVSDVKRDGQG